MDSKPTFTTPLALPVPLRSGEITVTSACVGVLLQAKAQLLPVMEALVEKAPGVFDIQRLKLMVETEVATAADITDLCVLLEEADVLVDLVAALAGMERPQALQLMPDEFAYLAACCVQVNWDFFAQALPVLRAALQRVQGLGAGDRPPGSGTSSLPVPSTA